MSLIGYKINNRNLRLLAKGRFLADLASKLTSHVSIYIHLDMVDKNNSIYFSRIGSLRLQHHRLDALANLKKSFLHKLVMLDNKR